MEINALTCINSFLFICIALSFGSFANVLIYRVPRELSIVNPGSYCPSCKHKLMFWDNIPLISYILLRGKCRYCATPISIRYPVIEALVAIIALPFIYKFIWKTMLIQNFFLLGFLIIFITIAVALAFIDNEFHKLPHELTYSGILLGLMYSFFFGDFFAALIAVGVILFVFDFITHFANKFFFKERALAITPAALTFRANFMAKYITFVYLFIAALSIYMIYFAKLQNLSYIFALIGVLYIINDIFIDFFFLSPTKRNEFYTCTEEEVNNEPLTALGGGDAAMAAFVASFLYLKVAMFSLMAAFYIALVLTLIEYLIIKIKGDKKASLTKKLIPLGSSLAIAAIIAMIIEYIL